MTGKRSGFSLFEMLIVVAIMGVIAIAAVPVAEITYIKTQETQLENSQDAIRQAIMLWKRDCRNVLAATSGGYAMLFTVPDSQLHPPSLEALVKPSAVGYPVLDRDGGLAATFYPKPYLNTIPADPFVGAAEWVVHSASGTAVGTYAAGITALPLNHVGVLDISCVTEAARRRGFVTAIDGTKYQDW
ncbi:MAG: hypothetical protein CVV41_03310 [Candidatus Riflebacteria bacterium HGW-Riflebacteria-1]|jgi:prepilin-type N-terminal cleavage/methylation domain-containing protein|nr:MAG: hypothetical protein CVV41_03310 [Candidatus Riflebacteria bacterium HGW-Riflebacteria-1]